MKRILTIALALCALPASAVAAHSSYPETIPLPNGWQPEGIATDGDTFYSGSRATGSIVRGNLKTGRTEPFVTRTGGAALGMKVDKRDRLFVAGGGTGTARVYDADDGDLLREYALTAGADVRQRRHADQGGRRTSPTPANGSSTCSTCGASGSPTRLARCR